MNQIKRRFLATSITLGALVCALAILTFLALAKPTSAIAPANTLAGAPNLVTYQGHLTNSSGNPINDTPDLKFGIYTAESGGTAIWEEIHNNVSVTNGYFTVLLGSITPLSTATFGNTILWLQVSVDTGSGYSDLPRQQLTAAPFALQAANADTLDGQHANAFAIASHAHPVLGCRVIATTTQSIPGSFTTPLSFTLEINDTNNCWSAANPTRLYARTAGYYMAGGAVAFTGSQIDSAQRIFVGIRLNGQEIYLQSDDAHTIPSLAANPSVSTGMFYMSPGDYLEIVVRHTFSGTKDTFPSNTSNQHSVNGWLMKIN